MTIKDNISVVISIAALLISATAAYYNLFRVHYELQLSLGHAFDFNDQRVEIDSDLFGVSGRQTFTFLNTGNRPIAITGVMLVARQFKEDTPREKCEGQWPDVVATAQSTNPGGNGSFVPTVIKAGEVAIQQVDFLRGAIVPPQTDPGDADGRFTVHVCFTINYVIPDQAARSISVIAGWETMNSKGEHRGSGSGEPSAYRKGELFTIVREGRFF